MITTLKQPLFSLLVILLVTVLQSCNADKKESPEFPSPLVHFVPASNNPVFSGTGSNTWDSLIRERGYILKEDSLYNLWYTGYRNEDSVKFLGYASSTDGINWTRFPDNPIYDSAWVEDMCVIKVDSLYFMFAEGRNDIAHLLVSSDKIHWKERGNLDIRLTSGKPISPGAYGTPTIWRENGKWYLFYERDDTGVWLATSTDMKIWTNVQDEPVLKKGPEAYDAFGVAMNQIVKFEGRYYGYYHATAFKDWHEWSTNVAVSDDLIHWKKYPQNPIVGNNRSSGILVNDGTVFRLYTMHPEVMLFLPENKRGGD
jgi:beta-1,2-mannobiose phosphorylase / 1,2-beta-oligomannan phosphorylase